MAPDQIRISPESLPFLSYFSGFAAVFRAHLAAISLSNQTQPVSTKSMRFEISNCEQGRDAEMLHRMAERYDAVMPNVSAEMRNLASRA